VDRDTVLDTVRSEDLLILEDSTAEDESLIILGKVRPLVGDSLFQLFHSRIRVDRDRQLDVRGSFDVESELV
jgi:hypothetical protein